jgi:hypothetical protein
VRWKNGYISLTYNRERRWSEFSLVTMFKGTLDIWAGKFCLSICWDENATMNTMVSEGAWDLNE